MDLIKLNDDYQFTAQQTGKKLRLVVYQAGVENVCRLETEKNLKKFIWSDDIHLFKGRLQLKKDVLGLMIVVKGKTAGIISIEQFINMLNEAALPVYQ